MCTSSTDKQTSDLRVAVDEEPVHDGTGELVRPVDQSEVQLSLGVIAGG